MINQKTASPTPLAASNKAVDVIVVGSGAGAMTAAIFAYDQGLSVIVIEKSQQYGGTSAMSGGGIWIPNHGMASAVADNSTDAFDYLRSCVEDAVPDEMLQTYLDAAPEMLAYLEQKTHLAFEPQDTYPDYYQHKPGAKPGGRTLDPLPYSGHKLGAEFARMRAQHPQTVVMGRFGVTMAEGRRIFSKESGAMLQMIKLMVKYWLDLRRRGKRDNRLVLGNALIGRLRHSLMARDIPLYLNTPLSKLLTSHESVTGVGVITNNKTLEITAKHGVILAAGGFEHNQQMRDTYLPGPSSSAWSAGNPDNTGDAITAAMAIGAATALMQHAWWAPAVKVATESFARLLFIEKSLPGLIFVNADGKRFGNEAAPYQDYGPCVYASSEGIAAETNVHAYGIFDARYRQQFMLGPMLPAYVTPDKKLPGHLKTGFFKKADSIAELAKLIDIDPHQLSQSISQFNAGAKVGIDKSYQRGASLHDQYYGDKRQHPNHCLAELNEAPFYAVKVFPGDLGTKGGLCINQHAQVLSTAGPVIEGLYAIGNTSASVMGSSYPGAGSTLGPAMTFGYLAAKHLGQSKPGILRH